MLFFLQLSNNVHEQVAREALLDWLEGVEKKPVRDDEMRRKLEREANWGQSNRAKLEIQFARVIPGNYCYNNI